MTIVAVWWNMKTNEAFSLSDDGRICVGDVHTDSGPRGRYIETISSVPAFIKTIQNDPNFFVEHLHPSLLPRRTRKVAPVGRRGIWVKWLDKTDGVEYVLKSDFSIRSNDGYHVTMHLPSATDVSKFIASLRREGHEIVYIHPRFQKPRDVVRRRGKLTLSPTRENGATANVRPVKTV